MWIVGNERRKDGTKTHSDWKNERPPAPSPLVCVRTNGVDGVPHTTLAAAFRIYRIRMGIKQAEKRVFYLRDG